MSYVPINAAVIAAAAAKAAKDKAEEEEMTNYKSDDLDKWEFKIVRSGMGKFRRSEAVRALCDQEAKAGWEMLEKFDNNRIRFKRRVEKRAQDQYLERDAYRTSADSCNGRVAALVIGLVVLLGGLVAFFSFQYDFEITDGSQFGPIAVLVGVLAIAVAALAVIKRRR